MNNGQTSLSMWELLHAWCWDLHRALGTWDAPGKGPCIHTFNESLKQKVRQTLSFFNYFRGKKTSWYFKISKTFSTCMQLGTVRGKIQRRVFLITKNIFLSWHHRLIRILRKHSQWETGQRLWFVSVTHIFLVQAFNVCLSSWNLSFFAWNRGIINFLYMVLL